MDEIKISEMNRRDLRRDLRIARDSLETVSALIGENPFARIMYPQECKALIDDISAAVLQAKQIIRDFDSCKA
jgi:hypothetical protein